LDSFGFGEREQKAPTASLDSNIQNLPKRSSWSTKQKRAYQRLLSGLTRAKVLGKKVRFMTLTSSPSSSFGELNEHFQVLRKRIKRTFGVKIDYIKFKTNEGYGVLHIIFVGAFIPQQWLSRNWEEIHGAKIVDIREVRGEKRLARYLISNYLVTQTFVRMSWSWGWVFRGFVSMWKCFVRKFGYPVCIRHWASFLGSKTLFWKQKGLFPELGSKAPYPWVRDEPRVAYGKF